MGKTDPEPAATVRYRMLLVNFTSTYGSATCQVIRNHATLSEILHLSKASQTDPEGTSFLRRALEWELQGAQVASSAFS